MSLGLVGRKVGMTRIFTDDGDSVPVTVLDVADNRIVQIKKPENDGYTAVQVTYGTRRPARVSKAMAGHFAKAGVQGGSIVREFRLNDAEVASLQVGGKVGVDIFQPGQIVDVSGMSIGKGFAGVIRRHHFSSNRATHGNSISHNRPGSTGQNQSPSKVFKGKRMAGHLGAKNRTVPNLEVVRVDTGRGLLLLKGSVPGAEGGHVVVKLAAKGQRKPAPAKAAPAAAKSGAKPAAKK